MTQTNPLQADAVVEQAQKIIIDWAEPWVADWLSKHGSFPPGLHMPLYVVQDLLAKALAIPLQGGDDVRADIPEGWRVYTVDASIEGRWRVKLKGPDRDYPAEEDWPAHRGPAYVCQVGHDLASGIAACVTEIRKLKEASDVD